MTSTTISQCASIPLQDLSRHNLLYRQWQQYHIPPLIESSPLAPVLIIINYDYDLKQCKGDACKPAQYTQYIVTSLQTDYMVNYKTYIYCYKNNYCQLEI